ncbi:hypothetical protein Gotur_034023 [Gossypium turneri]
MNIMRMNEQWVTARIKQKGDSKCIPWKNLKDLILAHPDAIKKIDVFALSIYGLVVFPKTLGHVDEAVTDLFDRLEKRVTLIPAILAETFRSLSAYQERERVDSLDVRSSYLHGSTVTFGRLIKFHIGKRILSGELRGCFQMRSYIGLGSLCLQLRDWLSVNSRIGAMVRK